MMRRLIIPVLLALSALAWCQSEVDVMGHVVYNGVVTIGPQNPGVNLSTITVAPSNPTQSVGASVTFQATGTYSDGSTQDVTSQALWTVAGGGMAASNVQNVYTCNQPGSVTVSAGLGGVTGTTTLNCQSLQISPTGILTASQGQLFAQLFTASNGTPSYTFSSTDLPSWLTLNNTGCPGIQVNCDLTGTQSSLGSYSFHITATDGIGDTLTVPITVQVVAVGSEDNRYCNSNGTTNVAGQMDGPANMIQNCVYDAIANTPAVCIAPACTVPILTVCPPSQAMPNGFPVTGCLLGQPPFYNSIQAALNALTSCGQWIQIYDVNWIGGVPPKEVQNSYDEKLVVPGLSCGPNDPSGNGQWIWVSTNEYGSITSPGTRISPAWAGQSSLTGYPSYAGPSTPGIYVPAINPSAATCGTNPGCPIIVVGGNGVVPSGFRFMGLEIFWTKSHATAPGYFGPMVQSGCNTADCNPGAQHIIFDRVILHACQDKSDLTCTDSAPVGFQLQDGNYQAVINSYLYGLKTIGDNQGFLGPQDESHGFSGGNIQGMCSDGPNKITNNFIGVASQPFFWGGASSDPAIPTCPDGSHSYDLENRRNDLFRPLTYMVGPFNPANNFAGGSMFDAWVGGKGTGYPPSGAFCTVQPPPTGVTATCGVTISGGRVVDATILTPGNGYTKANPGLIAWRYPNTDPACGPAAGCVPPAPALTQNTTGGTLATGHKISVVTVFVHAGDGYITDPQINTGGNIQYAQLITSGCTGGGCQVIVPPPTLPSGFSGFSVYSCDATGSPCAGQLQTASSACVNITSSCIINAVGTGPASGNEPSPIAESSVFGEDGIYIVKNYGECKHCVRELFEGNIARYLWTGQSDESATCWLLRATNDIEADGHTQNCPNCKVVDIVMRYSACIGASTGMSIGVQQATRGGTLAEATGFVSVHDNIFELSGMWITATNQFGSGGTLSVLTNNGQPGTQALQSIKFNHNTVFHTEPNSFPQQATNGSFLSLLTALCGQNGKTNTTAVWNSFTFENNIGGGGFRNISQKSQGCFQCQQSATCNSTLALNSKLTNSGLGPVVSGLYTTNQITGLQLTSAGTCSVPPASCSISGSGTGATCGLIFSKTGALTGLSLGNFGRNYTSATVNLTGGTCSVAPVAIALIGGAGNPSPAGPWCADHNINVTAGWPGEDPMTPDPTSQGDSTNSCFAPSGGGFIDVTNWTNVQFVNATFDPVGGLPITDDLHLTAGSPGHNASNGDNQGRDIANGGPTLNDMGADIDLVLLYTGCVIQSGKMVCP